MRGLGSALVAVALVGCAEDAPRDSRTVDARPDDEATLEAEALAGLGYAEFAEEEEPGTPDGVVLHRERRAEPGYNLYTSITFGRAVLVDMEGEVVRAWSGEPDTQWKRALLLPDGDLVVVAFTTESGGRGRSWLVRRSWDGELRWRRRLTVHHDLEPLEDGRFLAILTAPRRVELFGRDLEIGDMDVAVLAPDGEVESRLSLWEAYEGRRGKLSLDGLETAGLVDLFHANALQRVDARSAAARERLEEGQVLLTLRNQDAIALVDLDEERVVWSWGPGELDRPHEARLTPRGTIVLFDNGTRRGWSRLVEVDPDTEQVVWEYAAKRPETFFSDTRGTVQPLPGGNRLVSNSNRGEAFEVTPGGKVVWRFLNPNRDERGRRDVIRMQRYPVEPVDELRAGDG